MPSFKQLIITGHETTDPIKRKIWRFKDGEFSFEGGYMMVVQPARYVTTDVRTTTVIPLSEISNYQENNK
jgi:hypothetical protein